MKQNELVEFSAHELSAVIHKRQASCMEVMNAYLDHIEETNPKVHAIVSLQDRDDLMEQARQRDAQLYAGEDQGWMHGFPQAPKDMVATKGIRTTKGTPILKDWIPEQDAILTQRLKRDGAIITGKTNCPEWGYGSNSYNPIFETTGNPYDPSKTSGGSSGGAAAAVASRMQPVADGGDTMGSLRNPAAWCNVYGFRPSFGTVPKPGADLFAPCLSVDGSIARNVEDVALLYGTLVGYDPRDPHSRAADPRIKELTPENVTDKLSADIKGKKIAWMADWNGHLAMEEEILSLCEKALQSFTEEGVETDLIKPFFDPDELWEKVWLPIRQYSVCSLYKYYNDPEKRSLLKPEVIWEIESGEGLTVPELFSAFEKRSKYYNAMLHVFEEYDYIAMPTSQLFPFDKTIHSPKEVAGRTMKTYHNYMEVSIAATLGACAALSVPVGFNKDGLPAGMQLIAKPRTDFELLQFCLAYEKINDYANTCRPVVLT